METIVPLSRFFDRQGESGAAKDGNAAAELRNIVMAIANASAEISSSVASGRFASREKQSGERRIDFEATESPSSCAEAILVDSLRGHGVREVVSAGRDDSIRLDADGLYTVAIDALDGASNIDTNMPLGTIFSVSYAGDATTDRSGQMQLAAGFVVYGPQTNLVITLGDGVDIFTLDRDAGGYCLADASVRVPATTAEYAIDASNYRHWPSAVRGLIDDHLDDTDEPGAQTFNMRWIGSLVAEAYRILRRGGVFMCPPDKRRSPEKGCQRLLTAAFPIAFIMEQAGARASTGHRRILDRTTKRLDERTPFIFGSRETVDRIDRLHALPETFADSAPLFGKRGLFRV